MGGNRLSYAYDENGNVTGKLSSGSPTLLVSYTYDSLNRVKTRDYSDGNTPSVTYCYDGKTWSGSFGGCNGSPASPLKGHLTNVGSGVSQTAYVYNVAGQIVKSVQTTEGRSFTFGYTYNAAFALASQTYPSGRRVAAEYDDAGRSRYLQGQLARATTNYAGSAANPIQYAAHGALGSMTMGNGVVETRVYNSRLQPMKIQAGGLLTLLNCYHASDDSNCPILTTVSGNNGNVQGQAINRGGQGWSFKYSYDGVDRLSFASETNHWQQNYGYDQYGNRWISSSNGLPVSAVTPTSQSAFEPATNRLVGTNNYDARGNLKSYGAYTLGYDGDNRISSASSISRLTRYEYDGEGRRVLAYSCPSLTACSSDSGVSITIYVYDAFGKLAAEYSPNPGQSGTSYFTTDHLGSTRLETDASGKQVTCSDYLPSGEEIAAGNGDRPSCFAAATDNKIKFTGKERDAETGLDNFGARYFSAAQGRFTSDDPLNIPALQRLNPKQFSGIITNPQNWDGYAYSRNNPLRNIDPDGYLTIIVPGTWNSHERWDNSDFKVQVENSFGEKATVLPNDNMGNTKQAREIAAKALDSLIAGHTFAPGEKLNIIAHSHGGNVVAEATQGNLSHKIDTLVTLGTPIRPDYQFNESMIGKHLNVFSKNDKVQPLGGMTFPIPGSIVPGLIPASRELHASGVKNLDATSQANSHSKLWQNAGTWDKVVSPEIKK
jgi:RHS repeat-associated protein